MVSLYMHRAPPSATRSIPNNLRYVVRVPLVSQATSQREPRVTALGPD